MGNIKDSQSPVYGYLQRPSMVDFEGHISLVVFTAGCNFNCGFCHNASLISQAKGGISWSRLGTACQEFRKQWVDGVVISGGEPTLWGEELENLINLFKNYGFAVKLDTNGSNPDILKKVLPLIDYVSMDIKCSPDNYPALVGFSTPEIIEDSVAMIKSSGIRHEFRTTILEDFHTDAEMQTVCQLLKGAQRYILQPFLPRDNLPDEKLRNKARTSPDRLQNLEKLMSPCAQEVIARL
ncbi:MAG: anaerobic ribonucleoside-triphosphate reductase activating protein [Verrucomicrobiota bacterium]